MNDLIMIVIRFLLYLDLMVIFGLPFFQIYGISGVRHETYNLTNFRSFITFAVVTGIILTGINMLLVSNAMSGVTDLRELSIHVIEMVIEETDVGISWIVRLCALFTTLGALFLYTNKRVLSCLLMTMSGGVALATLAWGGHAVMHDGLHYYLHLLSDRKRAARTVLTGMCYSVGSATRQGSSSLTRFIGQSAMTLRT